MHLPIEARARVAPRVLRRSGRPPADKAAAQDGSHLLNFRAPERRQETRMAPIGWRRRGPVSRFDKVRRAAPAQPARARCAASPPPPPPPPPPPLGVPPVPTPMRSHRTGSWRPTTASSSRRGGTTRCTSPTRTARSTGSSSERSAPGRACAAWTLCGRAAPLARARPVCGGGGRR